MDWNDSSFLVGVTVINGMAAAGLSFKSKAYPLEDFYNFIGGYSGEFGDHTATFRVVIVTSSSGIGSPSAL